MENLACWTSEVKEDPSPGWNADLLAWAADLYLLGLNLVLAAVALLAPG